MYIIIGVIGLVIVMTVIEYFLPNKVNKNIQDYETNNTTADRKNTNEDEIRQMSKNTGGRRTGL